MNKRILLFGIFALTIAFIVSGCTNTNSVDSSSDKMMNDDKSSDTMMKDEDTVMKDDNEKMLNNEDKMMNDDKSSDTMMKDDNDDKMMNDEDKMSKSGEYIVYSSSQLAKANTGDVVLFFHAPWCPTCKALNDDINANLSTIPAGLTILKTDYDSNSELKKKYKITYQHTFVQVDKDGNQIKKWAGSSTLTALVKEIK